MQPLLWVAGAVVLAVGISGWLLYRSTDSTKRHHVPLLGVPAKLADEEATFFIDQAAEAGITFVYDNGDDPSLPGMMLHQNLGGGVAVVDYDEDGWPDLYFSQGNTSPLQQLKDAPPNRLYRNLGTGQFSEVTALTQTDDRGYGQGLAVGDFNQDGFADLYVANIGRNRLYQNNGDGTFSDRTPAAFRNEFRWTTSCLIADLNGDSFPDLYDVNYLRGNRVFTQVCPVAGQPHPRACKPDLFSAEQDRLYLSLGNGSFVDVTETSGVSAPDGKGLGIVAADFQNAGRLDLFISNDTTPNFYFVNETMAGSGTMRLREQAVARGVANDGDGYSQACMGIAVGDADNDRMLDLFVTNFINEFNTLYQQHAAGEFTDVSHDAGLAEPSRALLGFGTQFLDVDNDGWEDLVVANGHVDDFRFEGVPYAMRPQLFLNSGKGCFAEQRATENGVLGVPRLGRGLARFDWNRDGRADFVISNMRSRATLATNAYPAAGRFIGLELKGIESNRDAVGATVLVELGNIKRLFSVTGGGGYFATNDREILVGLGSIDRVDQVTIRWPSGHVQRLHDMEADTRWTILEGDREPIPRGVRPWNQAGDGW